MPEKDKPSSLQTSLLGWLEKPTALEECRKARPGAFEDDAYIPLFHTLGGRINTGPGWRELSHWEPVFPPYNPEGFLSLELSFAPTGRASGMEVERFNNEAREVKTFPTTDEEALLQFTDRIEAHLEALSQYLPDVSWNFHWNRNRQENEKYASGFHPSQNLSNLLETEKGQALWTLAKLLFFPANKPARNHYLIKEKKPLVLVKGTLQGNRPEEEDVDRWEFKIGSLHGRKTARYQLGSAVPLWERSALQSLPEIKATIAQIQTCYDAFCAIDPDLRRPEECGTEPTEETLEKEEIANATFLPVLAEKVKALLTAPEAPPGQEPLQQLLFQTADHFQRAPKESTLIGAQKPGRMFTPAV